MLIISGVKMLNIILPIFFIIVLHKVVTLASSLNRESWKGHKVRFALLCISLSLIAGGGLGVVFGLGWGGSALLCGIGGKYAFDRRLLELHRTLNIHEPKSA